MAQANVSTIIVGGGVGDQVFSYTPTTLTVGTAAYPVTRMVFATATATIGMGTAPGSAGAINVDAQPYTTVAFSTTYGAAASTFQIRNDGGGIIRLIAGASTQVRLGSGNQDKWGVEGNAGTSYLVSNQAVALIRGGSSNGFGVENSAASRTNFAVTDSGGDLTLADGTRSARVSNVSASGERLSGAAYTNAVTGSTNGNVWFGANGSSQAGETYALGYRNGSGNLTSAVEVTSTAGTFSTLALMKSGGNVVIGAGSASAHFGTINRPSVTASTFAAGFYNFPTLVANANGDVLMGVRLEFGTLTPSSFTGLETYAVDIRAFSVSAFTSPGNAAGVRIGVVTGKAGMDTFGLRISPPTGGDNNYLWAHSTPATAHVTAAGAMALAGAMTAGGAVTGSAFLVGATPGIDFSGAITNLTVVKGIVTAAS